MSTPPDPTASGSPEAWLRYAEADMDMARGPVPRGRLFELLCFHAQQAAEKSIKAVLVLYGLMPPRTHVLERLIDLLPAEVAKPSEPVRIARLSPYAAATRYPGESEPLTEDEYQEAVRLAESVLDWARSVVRAGEDTL